MATQTLSELSKYVQDELVRGVAEDIITVNALFESVPFIGYIGDAITVNREQTLGDAGLYSVGDTITHRTPSSVAQISFKATKLIGQVDMDKLVQVQGESRDIDITSNELSSKAKTIARLFQSQMVSGDGVLPNMNSFNSLVDSEQYTTASGSARDLSFEGMDELIDMVTSKDGQVDFLMGHRVMLRKFRALYRSLGGSRPETVVFNQPDGTSREVEAYGGIPFFRNDYLSVTETANGASLTGGNMTSLWAGCWDDGSRKVGLAAIYPDAAEAGLQVEEIGTSETKDEEVWRVKAYWNLANFNRRSLARYASIKVN